MIHDSLNQQSTSSPPADAPTDANEGCVDLTSESACKASNCEGSFGATAPS
jgi:hypothetical protein